MPTRLLLIRHSGLSRTVTSHEVLTALTPEEAALPREEVEINTLQFIDQINQSDWTGQAAHLAERGAEIHQRLATLEDAKLHYFGLAEIPHVIAVGAFLGDESPVAIHEFDREASSWAWPNAGQPVKTRVIRAPSGSIIRAQGSVVLRIEITALISDEDVHAAVGTDHLADVSVSLEEGLTPKICRVRSFADLKNVRDSIRDALAVIRAQFPNLELIHVFVAGPVSVCFALGQELKPRNSSPIQTYRFRKIDGQPAYTAAIELSSELETRVEIPLSAAELETVRLTRGLWAEALRGVETYAAAKKPASEAPPRKWYESLDVIPELRDIRPYPALPPIWGVVPPSASVDPVPFPVEFEFATPENVWRLNDRLLLGLHNSTGESGDDTVKLIRVFLVHEYLHDHHGLTAYRAGGIGAFPNILEHADYTADSYALLHQVDFEMQSGSLDTDQKKRAFLAGQLERTLQSFWAFEAQSPVREWQVRRFRRYLNWYWRLTQMLRARDLMTALRLLDHAPHVEVAGLHQYARGQRVYCRLDRLDVRTKPEVAVVLENEKILRVPDSTTSNIGQLLAAFQERKHNDIMKFFNGVYERASELGGALPSVG